MKTYATKYEIKYEKYTTRLGHHTIYIFRNTRFAINEVLVRDLGTGPPSYCMKSRDLSIWSSPELQNARCSIVFNKKNKKNTKIVDFLMVLDDIG